MVKVMPHVYLCFRRRRCFFVLIVWLGLLEGILCKGRGNGGDGNADDSGDGDDDFSSLKVLSTNVYLTVALPFTMEYKIMYILYPVWR